MYYCTATVQLLCSSITIIIVNTVNTYNLAIELQLQLQLQLHVQPQQISGQLGPFLVVIVEGSASATVFGRDSCLSLASELKIVPSSGQLKTEGGRI